MITTLLTTKKPSFLGLFLELMQRNLEVITLLLNVLPGGKSTAPRVLEIIAS